MTKWTPPYSEDYGDQLHRLFGISSDEMLTVTLQVTEDCNLRCSYCYQHNKSKKKMSLDTAKQIVDHVLALYLGNIAFHKTKTADQPVRRIGVYCAFSSSISRPWVRIAAATTDILF